MLKKIPFHPLLFCIYPVIYLYSNGISQAKISDIFIPLFINLGLGIIFYLSFYIFTKDLCQAATGTSIVILLFATFGHTSILLLENGYFPDDQRPIVMFYLVALIILTWINFRMIKNFRTHYRIPQCGIRSPGLGFRIQHYQNYLPNPN